MSLAESIAALGNPAEPGLATHEPAPEYAVVEIFGHRRHAGRVLEVERFGAKLLRVDVPTDGDFGKGFVSHFYGGSSIFSFTNTDLATVQRMNKPYERPGAYLPVFTEPAEPDADFDEVDEPGGDEIAAAAESMAPEEPKGPVELEPSLPPCDTEPSAEAPTSIADIEAAIEAGAEVSMAPDGTVTIEPQPQQPQPADDDIAF